MKKALFLSLSFALTLSHSLFGIRLATPHGHAQPIAFVEQVTERDASPVIKLTDKTFEKGISKGVVLVKFYADWCGPCRTFAPVFETASAEREGEALFATVDVSRSAKTADRYEVWSIPTVILFKDGIEIERTVGGMSQNALLTLVDSAL